MTRFGMGFGNKFEQERVHDYRPKQHVHSARCQQVVNKWFGSKDVQKHPDWMTTQFQSPPRKNPNEMGDWQLVWHPQTRPNTVTVPTRKVLHTLKDEEEKIKLKSRLADELLGTDLSKTNRIVDREATAFSQHSQGSMRDPPRDQLASQASSRMRGGSTRGSQRALSTAGSILNDGVDGGRLGSALEGLREEDVNQLAGERIKSSFSRASRASKASRRSQSSLVSSSFANPMLQLANQSKITFALLLC